MHMTPDRTFIGSQSQGYLLLLQMFARPALAVLGLFAAMLLIDPILDYAANAFFTMHGAIQSSAGNTGNFTGWIIQLVQFFWWCAAFALLMWPILYMVFSLPQNLPDHVLRWIGAGVADLGENSAASHVRAQLAAYTAGTAGARPGRGNKQLPPGGEKPPKDPDKKGKNPDATINVGP
jgi:hypothetical protein